MRAQLKWKGRQGKAVKVKMQCYWPGLAMHHQHTAQHFGFHTCLDKVSQCTDEDGKDPVHPTHSRCKYGVGGEVEERQARKRRAH